MRIIQHTKRIPALFLALALILPALGQSGAAVKPAKKPGKPAGFKAVASGTSVKLTWKAVKGAAKYEVHRATGKKGKFARVKTVSKPGHTDKGRTAGKMYRYKVRAYRVAGKKVYGKFSAVRRVTVVKPTKPAATPKPTAAL